MTIVRGVQAMVLMVMAEVQQMANTQNGEAFHARFVSVIARIQELLRQSREASSAAGDRHAAADSASDAGSAADLRGTSQQRSHGGSGSSAVRSGSSDSGDGSGSAMAEAGSSRDAGSSGDSRVLEDFMTWPAEKVWSQLERNGVSELQVWNEVLIVASPVWVVQPKQMSG